MNAGRRRWLHALWLAPGFVRAGASGAQAAYPPVGAPLSLAFPRDHGSHPAHRTEWWYVTGWTRDEAGRERGVQITFFRNRPGIGESSASAFAPRELLFAHAVLADPATGRLLHDQRAARSGFGLARASDATTDVRIDDWSLVLDGATYRARVPAREFTLDLAFSATRPILAQGDGGLSRKGPRPEQASAYYSRPHLAIDGTIETRGRSIRVRGTAWLDHEWASDYLAAEAAGWDWVGLPLDDGGALMAFRIRDRAGAPYWAGGAWQDGGGRTRVFAPGEVAFRPGRRWRSPRTGIEYPVAFGLRAGPLELELEPLMDDQELDARMSVGIVYWEGAVRAKSSGRETGRGYLELTGYGSPLRL